MIRNANHSAEWRNLLFPRRKKQVSRLRMIVRFATNHAPLEMTMKWGVTLLCKAQQMSILAQLKAITTLAAADSIIAAHSELGARKSRRRS
jgi:hypothetical protein